MNLGLVTETMPRTLARISLLRNMVSAEPQRTAEHVALADDYARARSNALAEAYVVNTLLTVGSRRMGACLRGEPWCDEMSGSRDIKAAWAAYREAA
jgi:hypothetical protein